MYQESRVKDGPVFKTYFGFCCYQPGQAGVGSDNELLAIDPTPAIGESEQDIGDAIVTARNIVAVEHQHSAIAQAGVCKGIDRIKKSLNLTIQLTLRHAASSKAFGAPVSARRANSENRNLG